MSVIQKSECLECGARFPDTNLPYPTKALVQALNHLASHGFIGGVSDDPAHKIGLPGIGSSHNPTTKIVTYEQAGKSVRIRG